MAFFLNKKNNFTFLGFVMIMMNENAKLPLKCSYLITASCKGRVKGVVRALFLYNTL